MPDVKSKLAARLSASDTKERCGFITAKGRIVETPNIADEPEKRFHIHPAKTLEALEKGYVATWHTHPTTDPNLSGEDYSCFLAWDHLDHYIVGRRNGEITVLHFRIEDGMVIEQ